MGSRYSLSDGTYYDVPEKIDEDTTTFWRLLKHEWTKKYTDNIYR